MAERIEGGFSVKITRIIVWVVIFETKRTDCRLALQRRVPINVDPVRRLRRLMTGFAILSVVERRCHASSREGERTGGG
jgi:hypothetical protein